MMIIRNCVENRSGTRTFFTFIFLVFFQEQEAAVSFVFLPATFSIPETTPVATTVYSLSPTGGSAPYTCSVTFQDPDDTFRQFAFNSLDIETVLTFDFEATNRYVLTVECVDSAATTGTSSFTVNILDINDEPPVLSVGPSDSVNEEQNPGVAVLGLFSVTDADVGDVLSYSLSGSDTSYFQIDPSSGTVSVKSRLDRDEMGARLIFSQLTLVVTDSAGNSAVASLTVTLNDINDNTPTFSPSVYYVTVSENSPPGQSLVTVTCTDPDVSPGNGDITYAVASGDDVTPKFAFSGAELQTTSTPIDYDTLSGQNFQYQLVITGTDGGTAPNTGTATLIVQVTGENEADPVWGVFSPVYVDSATSYDIREDAAIGTTVAAIQATDLDQGPDGLLTYSLQSVVDDLGAARPGVFAMDPVSGSLLTSGTLDRDGSAAAFYDVIVRASDISAPPRHVERALRVAILDVNENPPTFLHSNYEAIQAENEPIGAIVVALGVTDDDVTSTVSCTIVSGNEESKFQISALNNLVIQTVIDLDNPNSDLSYYSLVIEAVDGNLPEMTASASVVVRIEPVNEFNPQFIPASLDTVIMMPEDTILGTTVMTISATDDDFGSHGDISYAIIYGDHFYSFQLNSRTGALKLMRRIDFDTLAVNPMLLYVVATDGGGKTNTSTVTVSVLSGGIDVKPSCTTNLLHALVMEDLPVGSDVMTLPCSSGDPSENLTYMITSGNNANTFSINPSGVLQLQNEMDFDLGFAKYSLVVSLSSSGGADTVFITLNVLPVNEAAPVFLSNPVNITWSEETPTGTTLVTISATDADAYSDGTITYSITNVSPPVNDIFRMDTYEGKIDLVKELDSDILPNGARYIAITVTATDGGGLQETGTINLSVTDVNDNAPFCHPSFVVIYPPESTAGDSFPQPIGSPLTCSDLDDGIQGDLTYVLPENTHGTLFTVDSDTGMIYVTSALDYETLNWYTFDAVVYDGGMPVAKSTSVTVVVSVTNLNDGPPLYSGVFSSTVLESLEIGGFIVDAKASDPDADNTPEGELLYSLVSGDPDNQFHVDVVSGLVTVNKKLDIETVSSYALTVQAVESGGTFNASSTVNVVLVDVNDNSPVCSVDFANVTVSENTTVGDSLLAFNCSDADLDLAYNSIEYTLTTGDTSKFQVLGNEFSLKENVDYDEGITSYDLIVTASDGMNAQAIQVKVDIMPINKHSPVFSQNGSYTVDISEDVVTGTTVFRVDATDADGGNNGVILYSLYSNPKFDIDPDTGDIILKEYLDRETESQYTLTTSATDLGSPAKTASATVFVTVTDVNDNAPVIFPKSYSLSLSENTASGSVVRFLNFSDQDEGVNANVNCSLFSGNIGSAFTVDTDVSLSQCRLVVNDLNYEIHTSFQLVIRASGAGGMVSDAFVHIQILGYNEFAPVFVPVSSSEEILLENSPIGTVVVQLTATDDDAGPDGEVTYSLMDSSSFSVDSNTGEVITTISPDAELLSFAIIRVLALDGGSDPAQKTGSYTLTVTVGDINDVTPSCTQTDYSLSVPESAWPSTLLTQFSCSDPDRHSPNKDLTYTITNTTAADIFDVDPKWGYFYTAAGSSLDRESTSSYELTVTVSDGGTPPLKTVISISVQVTDENDNYPQICCFPYTASTAVDTPVGTSLFRFNATDADAPPYGTVRFSLGAGNTNNAFIIDDTTGIVSTQTTLSDNVDVYNLTVEASDLGNPPLSTTAFLLISIDIPGLPECAELFYYKTVWENTTVMDEILNITCWENDGDVLAFSLSPPSPFTISASGTISLASSLDAETVSSYTLVASVTDGRNVKNVTIVVDVEDVNEAVPVFDSLGFYTVMVSEQEAIGTVVAVVNATDADFINTTYFFVTGVSTVNSFFVNTFSGAVQINQTLDYETHPNHEVEITVVDGFGAGSLSSTATLTVLVLDVNDNPPVCAPAFYDVGMNETFVGSVANISCSDPDSVSTNLFYSISSGDTFNQFTVAVNTGELKVYSPFDFENTTTYMYDIVINVTDGNFSSEVEIVVTVKNLNEHEPVFTVSNYSVTLGEDTAVGSSILTVLATDQDTGDAELMFYSIVTGNEDLRFVIDQASGLLRLLSSLDREQTDSYSLLICARDRPPGYHDFFSSNLTVDVFVLDANDNSPIFTSDYYFVSANETQAAGIILVEVLAVDADEGLNGNITYSIIAGNADDIFDITGTNISIKIGKSLDYNRAPSHSLTVMAADMAPVVKSSLAVVSIQVIPVNYITPAFDSNDTVTVKEDIAAGSIIYTASARDSDPGIFGSVVYSLTAVNSERMPFVIDPISGAVQVWSDLCSGLGPPMYNLEIVAKDTEGAVGALSGQMTLSVKLLPTTDSQPTFAQASYSFSLEENSSGGTSVGRVTASGQVWYDIVHGDIGDFTLTNDTGEIKTSLNATFDFEFKSDFFLVIRASDTGSPPLSSLTLVFVSLVDLNDNIPTFELGNFTTYVNENIPVSSFILKMVARDVDTVGGNLTYNLFPTSHFSIEANTGVLTVSALLDRDRDSKHVLTIMAADTSFFPLTGTCVLTIVVLDSNDHGPVVASIYNKNIKEDIMPGSIVFTVEASDSDDGLSAEFSFTITSGNANNTWAIDEAYGTFFLINSLDRESQALYELMVVVSDKGIPPKNTSVPVRITIEDINDSKPTFLSSNHTFEISENAVTGSFVGLVDAQDNDIGENSAVEYELLYFLQGPSHFDLDPSTGVIITTNVLDRDSVSQYVLVCQVRDNGTPTLSSLTNVTVVVTDVNDNQPYFQVPLYKWILAENAVVGVDSLTVDVFDNDTGENAEITLAFDASVNGTKAASFFSLDPSGTSLTLKKAVQPETLDGLSFVLLAVDGGATPQTGSTSISVQIMTVNNNNPVFERTFISEAVAYDGWCTDVITTVKANDDDVGLAGMVYYYLVPGPHYFSFSVEEQSGTVRWRKELEKEKTYQLYINAKDNGSPTKSPDTYLALRVDSFDPAVVSISFPASVSKSYVAQFEDRFMADLTTIYRKYHPLAVPKLWCVEERKDYSQDLTSRRRRAIPPGHKAVTLHVYVLADNSSDSIVNFYAPKIFLTASVAIHYLSRENGGNLSETFAVYNWTGYGILGVRQSKAVEDELSDTSIIVICSGLGCLLFAILLFILVKCYLREKDRMEDIALQELASKSGQGQGMMGSGRPQSGRESITKVDPVTGNLFQYNSTSKQLRWLSTPDGKPLNLQTLQDFQSSYMHGAKSNRKSTMENF